MSQASNINLRYKNFRGSSKYKAELQSSLYEIMKSGDFFQLQRNKVLIKNTQSKTKNRFLILNVYRIQSGDLHYCCPICSDKKVIDCISEGTPPETLPSCLHTDVCTILWGNDLNFEQKRTSKCLPMMEVVKEKPIFLAVVHLSEKFKKEAGLIILTSKTLSPKCLSCSSRGKNFCAHIKFFKEQQNDGTREEFGSDDSSSDENNHAALNSYEDQNSELNKDDLSETMVFNPFAHDGPKANVFNVVINFIPTPEEEIKNRNISETNTFFDTNILIPKYTGKTDICKLHGNEFDSNDNIAWIESKKVEIEHTRKVNTDNIIILYRPTRNNLCNCKKFFTGENEHLLRVTSASFEQSDKSRPKKISFVSYEQLYKILGQLLMGGEKLDSFVKANNFMSEVFFGFEKQIVSPKILHKAFEIFLHALKFEENSNFCFECPQELEEGQKEDDFAEVEYSIVDGIQMGCQTNDAKGHVPKEYFQEETAGTDFLLVQGVESKDRTCIKSKKARDIISALMKDVRSTGQLKQTISNLEKVRTQVGIERSRFYY